MPIRSQARLIWSQEKPATMAGLRDLDRRRESRGRTGRSGSRNACPFFPFR